MILVAAGILAYGIHDLQEAAFLPGLTNLAFDVSGPSTRHLVRHPAQGNFNFTPATTVLQAVAWVLYVGTVLFFFLARLPPRPARRRPPPVQESTPA